MHMRIVNMWIANSIYSHNHSYYIIIHIRPINTEIQAEKEEQTDRPKQIKILGPTTLDDWGLTKKSHFNYKRWQYQTNLILIFLSNRRLWSNEMFTDLPCYDVSVLWSDGRLSDLTETNWKTKGLQLCQWNLQKPQNGFTTDNMVQFPKLNEFHICSLHG